MSAIVIRVADHAIDRYLERVSPHLTRDQAREMILRLVRQAHIRPRRPDWMDYPETERNFREPDRWAVLPELGIAFPLRDGHVLSCLTRAGMSDEQRERRNARNQRRRVEARLRRERGYVNAVGSRHER